MKSDVPMTCPHQNTKADLANIFLKTELGP